ncbi:cholinesterase [Purpureocillium lavendulum]|uniref:Cholinesterase n=1 Tax=Purpureocillium lavendulum TaxID=1247861 RepID=A0AB34FMM1_9HYPO|nr:cholinesterase [Purpureocillium lavendulum]
MSNLLQLIPTETLHLVSSYLERKDTAALARTNRHFYGTVNPVLYNDNFVRDLPMDSCVLWAADVGRLETIKRAHAYGANLEVTGSRGDADMAQDWADIPGRKRFFASGLHLALSRKHDDIFYYLLEHMSDLDIPGRDFCQCGRGRGDRTEDQWYPLHEAIAHRVDRPDLATALMKRGAYLSSKACHALYDAVEIGNEDLIDLLLEHPQVDAKDVNIYGETTLHSAARITGNEAVCRAVIRRFANDGVPIDAKTADGTTALGVAFGCMNLAAVEELLDLGADPNVVPRDVHDCGPLETILSFQKRNGPEDEQRRLSIVKLLVKNGVNVNRCTGNNFPCDGPPLWLACPRYLRIAEYLLENGARTDIPIITKWPDHDGARYIIAALFAECDPDGHMGCIDEDMVQGLKDAVVLLLRHGARIDEVPDSDAGGWYDHADGDYYDDRDSRPFADGDSALLHACRGVMQDEPACLNLLLQHATRRNVSSEHLQEAMDTEFSDDDADSDDETDKNEQVQRMLTEFMAREYPAAGSDDDQ